MANVKFLTGDIANLPASKTEGQVYFAIIDEEGKVGQIYFDANDTRYLMASPLTHSITIGNKTFDGTSDVVIDSYDGEYIKKGE